MKVLVSTRLTQGQHPGDFCHANDGELLYPGTVCDTSRSAPNFPDDPCGCGRSLTGQDTLRGTTTALVLDDPAMTRGAFVAGLRATLARAGWPPRWAEELADRVLVAAAEFPSGTIVGYRNGRAVLRGTPTPETLS
jgi:hypothetical protein